MATMPITETFYAENRQQWREWLGQYHDKKTEIWLIFYDKESNKPSISYLHSVEEALCFGWIDGIAKRMDDERRVQRFTPRRPKSNWTELNKERVRRLIAQGLMTDAGFATLPDLSIASFQIAPDILQALQTDNQTWQNFSAFPDVYKRIRVGYIEEMRKQPVEFEKRLTNFIQKTRQNRMFGSLE
jgi:uncharacterized protein YdeI (YjbR/CyaY-like superfamily)